MVFGSKCPRRRIAGSGAMLHEFHRARRRAPTSDRYFSYRRRRNAPNSSMGATCTTPLHAKTFFYDATGNLTGKSDVCKRRPA
jgi:hypothetical protein